MSEIKCPKCGTAFTVDESEYAKIVQQVHDAEFLNAVSAAVQQKEQLLKAENQAAIAKQEALIEAERAKAKAAETTLASELEKVRLEQQATEAQQEVELEKLRASLKQENEAALQDKDAALQQKDVALQEKDLQIKLKDEQIAQREREISDIREMRNKLSVKLLGESLEQHCEIAFNQLRATAFRNAEFNKDSEVVGGTKGDYIFREFTQDGAELISIMFEMKTEAENSAASSKRTNESHLKKLHDDRTKKKCEYAVLVSTLEAESELYNQGIVDMSHMYPKMFVVRPQFFIPIISLLRNAALDSAFYKNELKLQRDREIDITNFEEKVLAFQQKFGHNCEQAGKRFHEAIDSIDAAIKDLEQVKEKLLSSEKQLKHAGDKLEDLTIRRLTRGNPTMKEKFKALEDAKMSEDGTNTADDGKDA